MMKTPTDTAEAINDARAHNIYMMEADTQAQAANTPTPADHPAESAEQTTPPPTPSPAPTPAAAHKRNGNTRRSTAPRTEAEATTRIHYIDLNQVTGPTDGVYHRAIKKYVLSDEGPAYSLLDWTILIAYGVGIQEGQRRERQRRH